ncbi:hypothetical protein ACP70R_013799 [Stipagrostis hirtigluma subsp. patula]
MELFFELLLTAAATLLAAFLLATLFAANDRRPEPQPDRAAAAAIAEEVAEEEEEERIIEVDEVKLREGRVEVAPAEAAEGWVEVEKAPAVVVQEEPACSPEEKEEEGVQVKAAPGVCLGAALEEQEEGRVGDKLHDLTAVAAAKAVVVEASLHVLGAEAVPREVPDVVGLESVKVQDVGAKQHDLVADVAPSEVLDARPEKQVDQVVEVGEVLPLEAEAVEVNQRHLVAEVAPAAEVLDAGLEDKSVQAIEVRPDELVSETSHEESPDVVVEKEEEPVVEVKKHELAVEAAPHTILDVPLAENEERNDQQHVEEATDLHQEEQSKDEAKCEAHPVDPPKELVPEEELMEKKTDEEVSHEGSSIEEVITEFPVEEVALQGVPEDDAGANEVALQGVPEDDSGADVDFGEWEGIERSEVEKRFGAAAAFAASEAGAAALSKLDSDVQLQLQGLLKVAIDGPCFDSTQPLTLRPSSRAKWVAWQKLGNMHPEIAMEKYMNLLSETIPWWMGSGASDTNKHEAASYSEGSILTTTAASDQHSNQGIEDNTSIDEDRLTTSPNPEKDDRALTSLPNELSSNILASVIQPIAEITMMPSS